MPNFRRLIKKIPIWCQFGLVGILVLIAASAADYTFCGPRRNCLWGIPTEYTAQICEVLVHRVGAAMGVRYEYVPYFPNRATEIFLLILNIVVPLLIWFGMGVLIYILDRLVRKSRRWRVAQP